MDILGLMGGRLGRSHFLAVLITFPVLAAIVTACETVPREVSEAQTARTKSFKDSLDTYTPASPDEQALITLLKEYRDAYNASDLSRTEGLLTSNFELRYYKPQSEKKYIVMLQDRSMYLKKRSAWSPNRPRQDKLIMDVRSLLLHPEGKGAVVVAATTYKSKYFHPRYIETYGFKRTSDGWLLRRILVVPSQAKPEELEVQIILSRFPGGRSPLGDFDRIVKEEGPDAFVEHYQQHSKGGISNDETSHSVLFVFTEPPPPGTVVLTKHQFRRPGMGKLRPYRFRNYVRYGMSPIYVIENKSQAGGGGGSITYSVFVGGVLVAKKSVAISN